ncbi:MAG TPA: hypothetical protein VMU42_11170 [Candidatus Sulfotelmatobacter sp.]|nr:hypothetical protein [Candidatus Sulfotelmatobacter sp.]
MNATQSPPYDAPAPSRALSPASLFGAVASRAVAVFLLAVVAYFTYELPVARAYVAAALAICFIVQVAIPSAWLFFVPTLLPVFDLTLWSGRLYVTEFDLLMVATAAAHYLRAPAGFRFPRLRGNGGTIVILLVLSYLVGLWIGATPLPSPDVNQLGSYLSHYNAFRVSKSIAWALLLLSALQWRLAVDAAKTATLFAVGISAGLILVGLVVMWERGVFLAIAQHGLYAGRYAIMGALLDFTTLYRATAAFSELHTGGEAVDTYMSLAPPIAAAGALLLRRPLPRLICLFGLGFGTYAAVATFSRGLYAAYACGLLAVFFLGLLGQRRSILRGRFALARTSVAVLLGLFLLVTAYTHGGYNGLILGLALGGVGILIAHFLGLRSPVLAAGGLVVLALAGVYGFWHTFAYARYGGMDAWLAVAWAVPCSAAATVGAALLGGGLIPAERRIGAAITLVLLAVVSLVVIPATGGYRMVERFSTVSGDSQIRWDHWRDALLLMGPEVTDYAFGMGLGSFPRLYFRHGQGPETNGGYRYGRDAAHSWVSLGTGGFNLTQRVAVQPDTHYELSFLARTHDAKARLYVELCPRWILVSAHDSTPDCVSAMTNQPANGQWTANTVPLDSGKVGRDVPFGWPIILNLHNDSDQAVIDVTDVRLVAAGHDLLQNGDFAAGGDHWLQISDYEHLPWHVKNLYVAVFFETGAFGLLVFVLALVTAIARVVRTRRQHAPIAIGLAGALIAFVVDGLVGSLLDNPRPAFLFYVILFWALQAAPLAKAGPQGAAGPSRA